MLPCLLGPRCRRKRAVDIWKKGITYMRLVQCCRQLRLVLQQKELIGLWARAFVCSQRETVSLSTTLWHATTVKQRYFCCDFFFFFFFFDNQDCNDQIGTMLDPQRARVRERVFVVMNFSVIFICKFFEMCAILFPSSTSWHTKANISVEKKPSLSFTLFCCFSAFKKS